MSTGPEGKARGHRAATLSVPWEPMGSRVSWRPAVLEGAWKHRAEASGLGLAARSVWGMQRQLGTGGVGAARPSGQNASMKPGITGTWPGERLLSSLEVQLIIMIQVNHDSVAAARPAAAASSCQ